MPTALPCLMPFRFRRAVRRIRLVLIPLFGAACLGGAHRDFGAEPRSDSARLAHRDSFWLALSSLDLEALSKVSLSHDERSFVGALRRLMEGDLATAESTFRVVQATAHDSLLREGARLTLTASLQYRGAWNDVAAVPRDALRSELPGSGRASVEMWAGVLRGVPQPRIEFPGAPVGMRIEPSPFRTPMITVRVNGVDKHFWIDTGATITILTAEVADLCRVKKLAFDTLAVVTSTHLEVDVVPALISLLEIGPISVTNLPAMIVRTEDLRLPRPGTIDSSYVQIDGILGADVLRLIDLEIDSEAGRVYMRDPSRAGVPRARNLFWFGYPVVRLTGENDTPVHFGLDTGAQETFVTPGLLREQRKRRLSVRRMLISGVGGSKEDKLQIVPDLRLRLNRQPLNFSNLTIRSHRRLIFLEPDGVLGSDVNRVGKVRIDMTNGIFAITPHERERER
jgi:hypothetical protein